MEENKNLSFYEKILGNEGIKINVTANLDPKNYYQLGFTIVGSIFIAYGLILLLKKATGTK